jgi:hypothetical protein
MKTASIVCAASILNLASPDSVRMQECHRERSLRS